MYVNMHIGLAIWRFGDVELQKYNWLRQVVFQAAVASAMESALESAVFVSWADVHLFLCVSGLSADDLQCHFGKEGIRPCGFDEA